MTNEKTCPMHGPYAASYGSCPICAQSSGGRPIDPGPIGASEDDLATDLNLGNLGSFGGVSFNNDDSPTELPSGLKSSHRLLEMDEEETNLGFHRFTDDVTELEFTEVGPQAILWVKEGRRRGKIYPVKSEMVIGRKNTDLILDDPKVSNIHAKIVNEKDQYLLIDFHSKNGTSVNGERIHAETVLKENDIVKIGDMLFVFKVLE